MTVELMMCVVVVVWAAMLIWFDIDQRRLPNALTLPGALVILLWAAITGRGTAALLGALGLAGVYLVVHLVMPAAMGAGDVKLAIATGALTGAFGVPVWVLAALSAPLLTGVVGTVMAVCCREKSVPHGPSMCLASVLVAAHALV